MTNNPTPPSVDAELREQAHKAFKQLHVRAIRGASIDPGHVTLAERAVVAAVQQLLTQARKGNEGELISVCEVCQHVISDHLFHKEYNSYGCTECECWRGVNAKGFGKPKLYTESELAAKVAEGAYNALAAVKAELVDMDDVDATKGLISTHMSRYRQPKPALQNTHQFDDYGKCTKCGRLRPATRLHEVCEPKHDDSLEIHDVHAKAYKIEGVNAETIKKNLSQSQGNRPIGTRVWRGKPDQEDAA